MATFRAEAEEHLQALTANLLALERGLPAQEARALVEATFREMHTLKGAARSVGLMDVEALCQACEAVLSRLTREGLPATSAILRRLEEAVDAVSRLLGGTATPALAEELIDRLERARAEPAAEARQAEPRPPSTQPKGAAAPHAPSVTETVRVPMAKLEALTVQAEDLLVSKLAAGERRREAAALADALTACRAGLEKVRPPAGSGRPPHDVVAEIDAPLRTAAAQARDLLARLAGDQRTIAGTLDGLLGETRRLRMTPASTVLDVFPRMVRDLAQEQGKEVEWVVRGAELEVDRRVLEAMKDPLIHLVRNAIDHGIEPQPARAQAGKPPRGRVAVTVASLEGGRIEIRVEDDGRGIDLAGVREAAAKAGLLAGPAAEALPDDDVVELVYRSGLSTSPIITDVSGHGLGLAIVRERVERLGGRMALESRAGAGTSVRMLLPASIATFRGVLVRAGGQPFLLPVDAVERVIRVATEEVESVEGRKVVRQDGQPLFIAHLSELLELPDRQRRAEAQARRPCAVVRSGRERLGLLVEEVHGDQEVLVKELRPPLVRVRNVAGAGVLGTGQLALILRPGDLLGSHRAFRRPEAAPPADERRPLAILVVDDSITTRTMEKNLLEAAGYRVRVAVDGIDAWTALKTDEFDLVVSDVDMPRMDGFELTSRIRADPKLAELPVVLVTALESREHRERGIEAGANAYVVKSSFDQSNLLEIVRRLA